MKRLMVGLAVALLGAAPVWAGELDGEFAGTEGKAKKAGEKVLPASESTGLQVLLQKSDTKGALSKGSELDDESPTQAYRGGGWGRGWGGSGWGRGWGGWGRGWGGSGWGRGWGGGWGGWGRGWGGWGWGRGLGWGWGGWGWPYYASLWRPYIGYGYGAGYPYYPYGGYCW